jgi:dihydrolipoamide dehydrogenase
MKAGVDYVAGRASYLDSNVGLARQLDHGFVKILVDRRTGKLLGTHIIGEEASDVVHLVIAFMSQGAGLDDILRMIYIHPALPEIVRDAARDAKRQLNATHGMS